MGNNGDVVTVLAELADGLRLRTKDGQVADVQWRRMLEEKKQRVFLGHGHALTIDAAQAITSDERINALSSGKSGVTGFTSYVAETGRGARPGR